MEQANISAIMDSSEQDRDTDIQITMNFEAVDLSPSRIRELVTTVCSRFGVHKDSNAQYQISVAIVDDAEIKELNARFLNHQTTTDCLSFDLSEAGDEVIVFELIVNGEMAVRQAELRGHSGDAELALYITHALLHNLGFDDLTPNEALKMHKTEDDILQEFGYGLVYNRHTIMPEQ